MRVLCAKCDGIPGPTPCPDCGGEGELLVCDGCGQMGVFLINYHALGAGDLCGPCEERERQAVAEAQS